VFDNLNWWEIGALLVVALLIFGDKLPKVIADGLRMLRNLRAMANNATADLSRELGTDIKLEDLHPKAFIRKHILSEEEEQAIRRPLQGLYDDVKSDLSGVQKDLSGVRDDLSDARNLGRRARTPNGASANGSAPAAEPPHPAAHGFDADAT
jgi:sec-independent protein translocase protein TatB